MTQYIEIAKKLKALADRGIAGEKFNAQKKLDEIMAKYGITAAELEENIESMRDFVVPTKQRRLFVQVLTMVVGFKRQTVWDKRVPTKLSISLTLAEQIEIQGKFDFYWSLYQQEEDIFYSAFCQRNNIFNPNMPGRPIQSLTEADIKKAQRIIEMSKSVERRDYVKQLNTNNG